MSHDFTDLTDREVQFTEEDNEARIGVYFKVHSHVKEAYEYMLELHKYEGVALSGYEEELQDTLWNFVKRCHDVLLHNLDFGIDIQKELIRRELPATKLTEYQELRDSPQRK